MCGRKEEGEKEKNRNRSKFKKIRRIEKKKQLSYVIEKELLYLFIVNVIDIVIFPLFSFLTTKYWLILLVMFCYNKNFYEQKKKNDTNFYLKKIRKKKKK